MPSGHRNADLQRGALCMIARMAVEMCSTTTGALAEPRLKFGSLFTSKVLASACVAWWAALAWPHEHASKLDLRSTLKAVHGSRSQSPTKR